MVDSTGETVRHELDTFVQKKRGPGDHSSLLARLSADAQSGQTHPFIENI